MNIPVISVRGVGKEYRLGETRANSLRDAMSGWFRAKPEDGIGTARSIERDDRFWALKDVSFDVTEGEVLGVIGANGAGKSTLLKILSRITEPTTGEIELRGRVASLLEVGTGFNDELTGRENIILNGAILGMAKRDIDKKLDEIIDFSGVEKFLDTPVKRYSSGMKMRLAFAVAAHLEPEILIIDEVLAVGDAEFQSKCLGKMDDVARSGRTVLFVSHNMAAVENLCHRAILLRSGNITHDGAPSTIIHAYRSHAAPGEHSLISLADRPAQSEGRKRLMTSVCLRDQHLNPASAFSPGENIVIDVQFEGLESPTSVVLGVVLRSESDAPVMCLDNRIVPGFVLPTVIEGTVRCVISSVSLAPGHFSLDLYLGDRHASIDRAYRAVAFEINEADFYGSGKLPQIRGVILGNGSWSMIGDQRPPAAKSNESGGLPKTRTASTIDDILR
jgi:lipopolysaccharide transport system ATP-binding protein